MSTTPKLFRVAALITTTAVFAFGLTGTINANPEREAPTHVAVIDAGSSGTRLKLFTSTGARGLAPNLVFESSPNSKSLTLFADNPSLAGPDAIKPLLNQLDRYLESQSIESTSVPVGILATAGLRNLRLTNATAVRQILDSTRAATESAGYSVAENRILPASMEASLAWLDANALAGTLKDKKQGLGVIEIGGASAQVAFRARTEKGRGITSVKVDGMQLPVVAVSYLGLGSDLARTDMQEASGSGAFCFPNNSTGSEPLQYETRTPIPIDASKASYLYPRCSKAFAKTVATIGAKKTTSAPLAPSDLRKIPGFSQTRFIGLGGIVFSFIDFGIPPSTSSLPALKTALTNNCEGPNAWVKVSALFDNEPGPFAQTLCSDGTYMSAFIFSKAGVGVSPTRFNGQPNFDGRSPSWVAGFATTVLHP